MSSFALASLSQQIQKGTIPHLLIALFSSSAFPFLYYIMQITGFLVWIFFQHSGLPYTFVSLNKWCCFSHYLPYSLVASVCFGINNKRCIGKCFCTEQKGKHRTGAIKHSWPWQDSQRVNGNELLHHTDTAFVSSTFLSHSRTAKDGSCVFLSFSEFLLSLLSFQDIHLWNETCANPGWAQSSAYSTDTFGPMILHKNYLVLDINAKHWYF